MTPTALDDDPLTAVWQAAQGGTGGVSDDPVEAAWKAAQRKKPTAPVVAPRDVTATPLSPQSAPVDIPDATNQAALRAQLFARHPLGMAANLVAGVPEMLAHPVQLAESAVTAIPRAVVDAPPAGAALRRTLLGQGAPVTFKPGATLSEGNVTPGYPSFAEAGGKLAGDVMDVAALAVPGAEGAAGLADRVMGQDAASLAAKATFERAMADAQARGSFAAEGKATWAREQTMRDATDQRIREMPPQQGLLPSGQYEMGPAALGPGVGSYPATAIDAATEQANARAAQFKKAAVASSPTAPVEVPRETPELAGEPAVEPSHADFLSQVKEADQAEAKKAGQFSTFSTPRGTPRPIEQFPKLTDDALHAHMADLVDTKLGTERGAQKGPWTARLNAAEAELESRGHSLDDIWTTGLERGRTLNTERPGFAAAAPLSMIVGTGVGAGVGAAAAPKGKRGEGAVAGAMAGLALTAGGVKLAKDAMEGADVPDRAPEAEPWMPHKWDQSPLAKAARDQAAFRRTGAIGDQPKTAPPLADPERERIRQKAKSGEELTDTERTYLRTAPMVPPTGPAPAPAAAPAGVSPVAAPSALPPAGVGSRMAPKTPEQRATMEAAAVTGARAQRGFQVPTPEKVADAIEATYSPATRGYQANTAAAVWREKRGQMDHDLTVAQTAIESKAQEIEKAPVPERLAFMHAIETGQKQPNPVHQPAADAIRTALDTERDNIRKLGTGKLDSYIENYFPHLWQDPEKAKGVLSQILGRRPLRGSMAWTKQRTIPTIEEGIQAGLVPVSYNPVELTMLKLRDMRKYRMATEIVQDLEGRGLITQALTDTDKIPEGYAGLTHDPSFRNRYAPEPVAKIINNALSPGLRGNAAYDAYMAIGNTINRAQLGFSAFHAGMTTVEQMVSNNALAVSKLFEGHPLEAAKQFVKFPASPVTGYLKGAKLAKAYTMDPASLDPPMRAMVEQVASAGGRFKMQFEDDASKALKGAVDARQWDQAAVHLFPALMEKVNAPIMQHLVPRQKFGVFADLASQEIERLGEGAHADAVRGAVQKAWDSVDNRLGQVVYDNLFWHKATKDLLHASVRSVGWNWGTFRELGGGAKDVGAFVKDLVTPGRNAELSTRAQYAIALPITVGMLGALTQYLYTGKGPETLFDYFHPQTGTLDADGNPNRVVLPTYMKDVFAYGRDAAEGKPLRTIANKLNPLLAMVAGMLENKDYYGNEIRNPDDPFLTKIGQLAKYAEKEVMPFSVQNLAELGKRGASGTEKALTMVGVTPANRAAVRTPAQNKMAEYRTDSHHAETPEQVEAGDVKGKAIADLKAGNAGPLQSLAEKGAVTKQQVRQAEKNVGQNRLAVSFRSLPLDQAEHVFALATPAEQAIWQRILAQKRRNAAKSSVLQPTAP